ncbi:uncharacterized protein LOC124276195 isoform X2 [Haliotis rubra]|uniref:uncharacterized protein LOC124276195 isoform X2 n=1 Tax=Haliotis rubra TaxID=36100 RepID=UPI001EE62D6A|nr:uncharacterized protein LOC124276195 isoform X2 [Haliotis rubra]
MSSPAFLLSLLILPVTCEGQIMNITLTGSALSAVTGHPFTFTCDTGSVSYRFRGITWTRQLKTGTQEYDLICNTFNGDELSCMSAIYNCTCSTNGRRTLTIPNVDFDTYQNSNWTCEFLRYRSNSVSLDVNVPLKRITLFNSTQRVKRVTEGERVTLVCETNPTKPPSTITWMIGEDVVTGGVTSRSRDSEGLTTTVSNLARTVTPGIHMKEIRCDGSYNEMNLKFTSKVIQLAVEGTDSSIRNPVVVTETDVRGLTFGAGVGVGMTVCLVPLLVAVAIFTAYRRRQTVTGAQQHTLYEGIDDSTRERNGNTSYEELRIYQNTSQRVV